MRKPFAGRKSYLRAASHNPATIYHEFAHHLCRHTADLRLNAERPLRRQRNGKPAVEEGLCDYFAAALLGTGRPFGWYSIGRGRQRDPEVWPRGDDDVGDLHIEGARWAALFWNCRQRLASRGLDARDHDRVMVATLLALGEVAQQSANGGGGPRRRRQAVRCDHDTIRETYLAALGAEAGRDAAASVSEAVNSNWISHDHAC
jgi:hypothetical protein